jgi:hypothetical protein
MVMLVNCEYAPARAEDGISDYDLIEAAVMETARGRWFLAEHARRNRHAETENLRALLEQVRKAVQKTKRPTGGLRVQATFMQVLSPSQVSGAPLNAARAAPQHVKPESGVAVLRVVHAAMSGGGDDMFDFSATRKAG